MKLIFLNQPINLFCSQFFFIYIQTSKTIHKNISAKYYQENKKKTARKKLVNNIRIFLKKKKKKGNNVLVNITKISHKMKKINWLSVEKKYYKMRKKALL